ncbi:MAG: TrbC/VirB2 family protein [Parcubacteria group bacterium]
MNIYKNFFISLVTVLCLLTPIATFAQVTANPPIVINIPNPTNAGSDLMSVLNTLLTRVVMPIATIAVVMYIIWAGFSFLTAQGNTKKIGEAKSRLLWALIGAGILLGAAGISALVQNTVTGLIAT